MLCLTVKTLGKGHIWTWKKTKTKIVIEIINLLDNWCYSQRWDHRTFRELKPCLDIKMPTSAIYPIIPNSARAQCKALRRDCAESGLWKFFILRRHVFLLLVN